MVGQVIAVSSETAFGRYQTTKYFTALDGLRALSAALVVAWHTRDSPLAFLQGERGVTVFFVLSGFLITMLALREEDRDGSLSIRDFFMRRVFRILPLYYVVLVGYAVLTNFVSDADKAAGFNDSLLWYIFYLSEVPLLLNEVEAPFNHSWSLGIEEKFYLVWPFVAFALLAKSKARLPLALGAGSLLLLAGFIRPGHGSWVSLIEPYGHILVGTALAFALHHEWSFEKLSFLRRPSTYWILGAMCAVVGVVDSPWAFEFLAYPTALFVGAMVLQPDHPISRMFSTRLLVWLGTLSYAVYLIHPAVLALFERFIPSEPGRMDDLITMVLGYIASALIGVVLHRTIEKPFIKYGRRFTKPRAKDLAEDAAAVPVTNGDNGANPIGTDNAVAEVDADDELIDLRETANDDLIDLAEPSPDTPASGVVAMGAAAGFVANNAVEPSPSSSLEQGPDSLVGRAPGIDATEAAGTSTRVLEPWGSGDWVQARGTATIPAGKGPGVPYKSLELGMFDGPAALVEPEAEAAVDADATTHVAEEVPVVESVDNPTVAEDSVSVQADHPAVVTTDPERRSPRRRWLLLPLFFGVLLAVMVLRSVLGDDSDQVAAPPMIGTVVVEGNQLIVDNQPVRLHAVTVFGSEYACVQGWGIFDGESGPDAATAFASRGVNAVRVPLNEHCWLGLEGVDPAFSGPSYQQGILDYIDVLRSEEIAVLLTLGWSAAGDEPATGPGLLPNADHSTEFWQSVAARVDTRSGVFFDLFVTPVVSDADCYLNGCDIGEGSYTGTQQLVDAIRSTGSTLPIVVSMPEPDGDGNVANLRLPNDPLEQLVLGIRGRFSADCPAEGCWSGEIDEELAELPLLATIMARSCDESDVDAAVGGLRDLVSSNASVVVPGWNSWSPCEGTPVLISDLSGSLTEFGEVMLEAYQN